MGNVVRTQGNKLCCQCPLMGSSKFEFVRDACIGHVADILRNCDSRISEIYGQQVICEMRRRWQFLSFVAKFR